MAESNIKMYEITKNWMSIVESETKKIYADIKTNKGNILTEGDLECELYRRLLSNTALKESIETKTNGWNSRYVHSQVTWFKPNSKSRFLVDLTILNPAQLNINNLETVSDYPNKGFFYNSEAIGIELKFIRTIDQTKIIKEAACDYNKVVNKIIPSIRHNIVNGSYKGIKLEKYGFVIIVACKTKKIYSVALKSLKASIGDKPIPENVLPIVFSPQEITILI